MFGYILKRLIQLVFVFVVAVMVIFIVPRAMPGNPADLFISQNMALSTSMETIALREQLILRFGLNKSLSEQFILYLKNVFTGYFGISWSYYPNEVLTVILGRLPWTLFLMISSRVITIFFGYVVGVVAAWKQGGKLDITIQILGLLTIAVPVFWVGALVLMAFAYYIPIFPLKGALTPGVVHKNFWEFASDAIYHAVLPIFTLSIFGFFGEALVMRNTMVHILGEDFMLTAEAKGLKERTVMFKHGARNAMLPYVTGIFMGLGGLITGAIFVESVFGYPGMGQLLMSSIMARDFPLMQGIFIMSTAITLMANLLADLVYMVLDPRVRLTRI
ncbi:MAG: ABC transporter permease [Candidatus Bathyarchaeia archaeon]